MLQKAWFGCVVGRDGVWWMVSSRRSTDGTMRGTIEGSVECSYDNVGVVLTNCIVIWTRRDMGREMPYC